MFTGTDAAMSLANPHGYRGDIVEKEAQRPWLTHMAMNETLRRMEWNELV